MQIDNIYQHKDGQFELIDFEWVGKTNNPMVAVMYDYGNLRVRAWPHPPFQTLLDNAMREVGEKYYADANMLENALVLGKLRSSLQMCRYFLDYENTTKNDKHPEDEYHKMYENVVITLQQELANHR